MNSRLWCLCVIAFAFALGSCSSSAPNPAVKSSPAPAKVQSGGVKEADLATIALTEQAEKRLGITTAPVSIGRIARYRVFAGEVVLPPGNSLIVSAPVAGVLSMEGNLPPIGAQVHKGQVLFNITPLVAAQRDLRVTAEAELASARSRLESARLSTARAEQMLADRVGSVRAVEETNKERKLAETAFGAAQARLAQIDRSPLDADVRLTITASHSGMLRQIFALPGQKIAGGAPLFEIADYSRVWIKVPVYAGEVPELDTRASARVENLGATAGPARSASPVAAPPTADPLAATIDLYYEILNSEASLHPGEKLSITLPAREPEERLQVPRASVLYDYSGGSWVYENTAPHLYTRIRVDVQRVQGETAVLARGPKAGSMVVTAGAAELFGTEFGAGK